MSAHRECGLAVDLAAYRRQLKRKRVNQVAMRAAASRIYQLLLHWKGEVVDPVAKFGRQAQEGRVRCVGFDTAGGQYMTSSTDRVFAYTSIR